MYSGLRVIAIAPAYNEEAKIGKVVERLKAMPAVEGRVVVDEVLVVDDGSTDASADVARRRAAVCTLGSVLGVGAALRAGFKHALFERYDVIVVLAGNNKDEPNEIPALLAPIASGKADFVQGSRDLVRGDGGERGGRGGFGDMPLYRRLATRLHPLLFSLCTGRWVTESTNGFRALRAGLLSRSPHQPRAGLARRV